MLSRLRSSGSELGRHAILLLFALVLFEFAANAVGPMVAVDGQRYLMIGCAVGLFLAFFAGGGTAEGSGRRLALWTEGVAPLTGWVMLLWPEHARDLTTGLVEQSATLPAAPSAYFALVAISVCLASWCGWLLLRKQPQPWPVIALLGGAFLTRADVARVYEDRFPLFVLAAVALVACAYAPSLRRLLVVAPTLALAALVLLLSWRLPAPRANWSLGVGYPIVSFGEASSGGGSQSLTLTGAFHPSNQIVMSISINRPDLHPYWATSIFDFYDGQSWKSSATGQRDFLPFQSMNTVPVQGAVGLTTTVQVIQPTDEMISVGTPVRSSLATVATYAEGERDPVAILSPQALPSGAIYEIDSILTLPAPARVTQFLQLPPEPPTLRRLAQRIAAGQPSVLGKALALQRYLRDSGRFHYDISAGSPVGQDAVVNFLFRSHRGYCTQFASALVILARELGIPARLISGYDSGEQFLDSFTVRQRDAHSWAQLLIPRVGWVSLDPTPGFQQNPTQAPGVLVGQQHLTAPVATAAKATVPSLGAGWGRSHSYHPPPRVASVAVRRSSPALPWPLPLGIVLLIGMGVAIYYFRPRSIAQLYASMVRATPRQYDRLSLHETPLEYAARFRAHPGESADVKLLVQLYSRERYAQIGPTDAEMRSARQSWRRLRRTWWLRRVLYHQCADTWSVQEPRDP